MNVEKELDQFESVAILELTAALYEQPEIAVNTTPVTDARPQSWQSWSRNSSRQSGLSKDSNPLEIQSGAHDVSPTQSHHASSTSFPNSIE